MSRITCIIIVICFYGSCLASSLGVAEPSQSTRNKRATLGLSLGLADCSHVGSTCAIQRDKADKPTQVNIQPCCEHLYCAGIGPNEIRNALGQAIRSDELYSTGICTLGLDNNQATKDHDAYVEYVKGL